tara:strand:+ start:7380 stop:7868 length:489 start_codon:yes stop_codon:yes gene_type:complete
MKNYREYEVFILNTSGIEYSEEHCTEPHVIIGGTTVLLTPENLPCLYDNDVEYMERFVFSIPDMPATEDTAFIDWYKNILPTQVGRSVLWENGWYAEDSVSLVRPHLDLLEQANADLLNACKFALEYLEANADEYGTKERIRVCKEAIANAESNGSKYEGSN